MTVPSPGELFPLPLTDRAGDDAQLKILLVRSRLLWTSGNGTDPARSLAPFEGDLLVEVRSRGRVVLPGAWLEAAAVRTLSAQGREPVAAADLRLPAVVLGTGSEAVLAWGETRWQLPFDDSVAIPGSSRPGAHSLPTLRRLALVAAGRRQDVGLTLWRDEDFEIPWHDVRLAPRAGWWFELAQVPPTMRYADAARAQSVPVERLLQSV
jgi:hypothetical protein